MQRGGTLGAQRNTDSAGTATFVHHLVGTVSTYVTLSPGHQQLAEFDLAYHPRTVAGERAFEIGGLALGYNVAVHKFVELITQLYVDVPQRGEKAAVGVLAGLIVSLPMASQ